MRAPIVLFCYSRLIHTQRTVDALLRNDPAKESDLIVFSDAAKNNQKQKDVAEVRRYLDTIRGFKSISIHHRSKNLGLAQSIISGVTELLKIHERLIVLEDDMETSPHFLTYMNEALELFADDERIASIHGYIYPTKLPLPEAFFLRGADCWGWATWRRGWAHFNPDGSYLLKELKQRGLLKKFDFDGAYAFSKMLENQINGLNDSWAVRWHASIFLANKLTLYPGRSLVHNIGNDNSGSHCISSSKNDVILSQTPIDLQNVNVAPSIAGLKAIYDFFQQDKRNAPPSVIEKIFKCLLRVLRS